LPGLLALTAGPFSRFTLVALRAVHCSVLCAFRRVARRRCTLRRVEKLLYPPNPPLPAQVRQVRLLVKEVRGCKSQALLHKNALADATVSGAAAEFLYLSRDREVGQPLDRRLQRVRGRGRATRTTRSGALEAVPELVRLLSAAAAEDALSSRARLA